MNDVELRKFIGSKISEYRKKKKLTQKELGEKIGVQNNTISAYERGVISPDSDTLFEIGNILDVPVDDLFPPMQYQTPQLDDIKNMTEKPLSIEELRFLQSLIEKTLSLDTEEREKFLDSIRFTVSYYENNKRD